MIDIRGIRKSFAGVEILRGIDLSIDGTEEHFHFPRNWWQDLNPWDHFTPERVGREGVGRTWQDIRLFPSLDLPDNIAAASRDAVA